MRIIHKLNQNIKTTIATKIRSNRHYQHRRQYTTSKTLLGRKFTLLIGQINIDVNAEGYGIIYSYLIIVSLLFMDDIALTADLEKQLQEMLNHTNFSFNNST